MMSIRAISHHTSKSKLMTNRKKTSNYGQSMDSASMDEPSSNRQPINASLAPLKISDFKIDDYLMTSQQKEQIKLLRLKFKEVDDKFLDQIEKRNIIFVEDGIDLKKDCQIFEEKARKTDLILKQY